MVGACTNGRKIVLMVEGGVGESKETWGTTLRDLRMRGLKAWPMLSGIRGLGHLVPALLIRASLDFSASSPFMSTAFGVAILIGAALLKAGLVRQAGYLIVVIQCASCGSDNPDGAKS